MRFGIIIGRIGGVDGVALETEKWIDVLKREGHEVFILSGQYEDRKETTEHETLLPILSFFSPECLWEQSQAFFNPVRTPDELLEFIDKKSEFVTKEIIYWLLKHKIDIVISENASALPSHLIMGMGIKKAVELLGIKTITHDHDFGWERGMRYVSPHDEINKLVEDTFPLRLPNVVHAVINQYGKETLQNKFGRDSIVVPNVMDFDKPYGFKTDKNDRFRKVLGLKKSDILLFQVTRIVRRKGIEVALELVHKLKDKNIKLVITGNFRDDHGGEYSKFLLNTIKKYKIDDQVIFASKYISHNEDRVADTEGLYILGDAYANARACTYFSTYEGFGNAFVEAVMARTPIFVNNYKPVYWPDIGSKGFKTVMLENNELTDEAVNAMAEIIYDEKKCKEIAEYNFELGKKYFSYETLSHKLNELFVRFI